MLHRSAWKVFLAVFLLGFLAGCATPREQQKTVLLVAGKVSHGPGDHEFRAGALLLQKCLNQYPGITAIVASNGWPTDESLFDKADTVIFYMDGGGGHPVIQSNRLKLVQEKVISRGGGMGCLHYAVEVPKDRGGAEFLQWIGGYFETFWSVNPHWDADFTRFPKHPITRGVAPFKIRDEWYYHMRFAPEAVPILTATPPDSTRGKAGVNQPHGGNPHVQARTGQPEHVMWAIERRDGGRGFGFTGAHHHKNWGNENFRKVVLNAILWSAKVEVPSAGFAGTLNPEDLTANLDPKPPGK
jgi:type 1 glutamine amidotransferase